MLLVYITAFEYIYFGFCYSRNFWPRGDVKERSSPDFQSVLHQMIQKRRLSRLVPSDGISVKALQRVVFHYRRNRHIDLYSKNNLNESWHRIIPNHYNVHLLSICANRFLLDDTVMPQTNIQVWCVTRCHIRLYITIIYEQDESNSCPNVTFLYFNFSLIVCTNCWLICELDMLWILVKIALIQYTKANKIANIVTRTQNQPI